MRTCLWLALTVPLTAVAPAVAQPCSSIQYRLAQGEELTWFDTGAAVPIPLDEEVLVYVQVRSLSETPYLATAVLGWPWDMGYDMPTPARSPIAIREQSAEDRRAGRIAVRGREPGQATLAYRLEALAPPGRLEDVAEECRSGLLRLHVRPDRGEPDSTPPLSLLEDGFGGSGLLGLPVHRGFVHLRRDRTAELRFWEDERRTAQRFSGTWRRSEAGFRLVLDRGPDDEEVTADGVVTVVDDVIQRVDVRGSYPDGQTFTLSFVRTGSTAPPPQVDE